MEINKRINEQGLPPAKEPKLKLGGISETVLQNLHRDFAPNNPINTLLSVDNQAYYTIYKNVSDKAYVKLPYLVNSSVFHAEPKLQKDISRLVLKLTPYNLIDGLYLSSVKMYEACGVKEAYSAHYRVLAQSYFLRTALCVGLSSSCDVRIITANPAILSAIPTTCDVSALCERLNPRNDDLRNGVLSCVRLSPNICGYDVKPFSVTASDRDFVILPKFTLDYFINYIQSLLNAMQCEVKYATPNGDITKIIACNRPSKEDFRGNISARFIDKEPCKYGVIRCVEVKTGRVVVFPITHLISLHKV